MRLHAGLTCLFHVTLFPEWHFMPWMLIPDGDHVVGGPTEFSYEPGQVFTIACGQLLLDMRIDVLGDGVCSVIYRFRDN